MRRTTVGLLAAIAATMFTFQLSAADGPAPKEGPPRAPMMFPRLDKNHDGKVAAEFHWAALDCPGYFAVSGGRRVMLLGEMQAHLDRRVRVGESCTVIGWRIGTEGRKHQAGTAIFDGEGELCARARATWIEVK